MKGLHPKPKVSEQQTTTQSEAESGTGKEELVSAGQALASASSVVMDDEEEPVSPRTKPDASSETISQVTADSAE